MYTTRNFKTKKELKEAVERYNLYTHALEKAALAHDPNRQQTALEEHQLRVVPPEVRLFAPGLGTPKSNGIECVEGPHYPQPHRWYAQVELENGVVIKVK